jgi:cell division protein FtsX
LISDRPRAAAWTVLAAACALTVAAVALVIATNLERWTAAPTTGGGSMVVYLGEGVSDQSARALVAQLAKQPGVAAAELVAPEIAAKRLELALGADAALLDGVDLASLPGTVEVTLAPGVRDVISMSPMLRALRSSPGIEDVIVEDGGEPPTRALGSMRTPVWICAALLAGLALVVVLAAIRVRFERDRQEHAVLHLLGASPAFTAVPTALAGAVLGLGGSIAASLVVWLAIERFGGELAVHVTMPAVGAIALFIAAGAGLGLVAGGLAGVARVPR